MSTNDDLDLMLREAFEQEHVPQDFKESVLQRVCAVAKHQEETPHESVASVEAAGDGRASAAVVAFPTGEDLHEDENAASGTAAQQTVGMPRRRRPLPCEHRPGCREFCLRVGNRPGCRERFGID